MNGEPLRERRTRLGLTQAAVSSKAGIGQLHYAAIEQGRVGDLKASTVKGLAVALGTTADELLKELFADTTPAAATKARTA